MIVTRFSAFSAKGCTRAPLDFSVMRSEGILYFFVSIQTTAAAKRAAAVVWMLEKRYGISVERITEESKGARVQPFAENNMNRVSIMIAK